MKTLFSTFSSALTLLLLLTAFGSAHAQGPRLDPAFQPTALYTPGSASVQQQADGKYVLLGNFTRVLGTHVPGTGLVRLLANGTQLDAPFNANVAGLTGASSVLPLANGKLLLLGPLNFPGTASLSLGAVQRNYMLLLLPDGTPDAGFTAALPTATQLLARVVPQPDGKLLVAGTQYTAATGTQGLLRRLNADGSPDLAFETALGAPANGQLTAIALQPDGKVLVVGRFSTIGGQARPGLARLLPTGALDASFAPVVPAGVEFRDAVAQPDGKIVVASTANTSLGTTGWVGVVRLLPTGALDSGFQTGTGFTLTGSVASGLNALSSSPSLLLQPDGKLLVSALADNYNGTPIGRFVRLLPTGALDPNFDNLTNNISGVSQVLPNGQLLASGSFPAVAGPPARPRTTVARLNADGTRDLTFFPRPQGPGIVYALARQADGKLLIGGEFDEVNGTDASYLARLNADGTSDAAYTAAAAADGRVTALTVQPDGQALAAGEFTRIGGAVRPAVARLTATGTADPAFAPTPRPLTAGQVLRTHALALQANGKILLYRQLSTNNAGSTPEPLVRLEPNGQLDASFNPSFPASYDDVLVQPDGKVVGAGNALIGGQTKWVWRMLPDGTLDPAFTPLPSSPGNGSGITLAYAPGGKLYVGGAIYSPAHAVQRLLPDGTPDASFQPFALTYRTEQVRTLTVQPNGRLLVGGSFYLLATNLYEGSFRLLPDGTPDASYATASGPAAYVLRLLVQPDGAIVAGGSFRSVAGLGIMGLNRLLDANVLSVSAAANSLGLDAWPVPAHDLLHLRLDAAARPQQVRLLDALGRAVRMLPAPAAEATLDTRGLPPGIYLLQVRYAAGTVARRISVE